VELFISLCKRRHQKIKLTCTKLEKKIFLLSFPHKKLVRLEIMIIRKKSKIVLITRRRRR
jgi:hypothetical protein